MKRPDQAIVLAAGMGTRLRPLTFCRPKPLVPVWGTPMLRHVLELLREWGVREVLVNLHHGAGAILDYLRRNPPPGLRCSLSFEPEILGTGGALPRAAWFLRDRPFWIMNADVLGDLSPVPLLRAFERTGAIAALWLDPSRGPRTVETRNGLITNFRSRTPAAHGTATFCGLQLASPRLLRHLPASGFSTLVDAYEEAMRHGERVAGVTVAGAYWSDVGNPDDYRAAHRDTRAAARAGERGSRFAAACGSPGLTGACRDTAVGRRCRIARGARLTDCILWDDVVVGPRARLHGAVIADGVRVDRDVPYMALRADRMEDPALQSVLGAMGWEPGDTTVMPLPPRGSARSFTRLCRVGQNVIVVRYSLERPENGLYAGHARFLRQQGLHVPEVVLDRPGEHYCVLEDVGEQSLQDLYPAISPRQRAALYRQVLINDVVALHDRASRAARRKRLTLCPAFGADLYAWEQGLFHDEFLLRHLKPSPAQERTIARELRRVIPVLLKAPQALVHRDLQSSNILLHGGSPVLIDFQGMRFGAPAYDLASLLCDPYVRLPTSLRESLLSEYAARAPHGAAAVESFWAAAVERLVQALGAYGRLGATRDTRRFLRHIPAAVEELRAAAARVKGMPCLEDALAAYAARLQVEKVEEVAHAT